MKDLAIHFVGRHFASMFAQIGEATEEDLHRHPTSFNGGSMAWIFQTYLRLRESLGHAGFEVSFGGEFREGAINIAHRDSLNRWFEPYYRCYVVGVRADRSPAMVCDWEIVQNRLSVAAPRQTFVPHWPQPGLIEREPARGTRITQATYFGRLGTTSPWLRSVAFKTQLLNMGVAFDIREKNWFDYGRVDLVIAHRREAPTMLRQKPASKLVNAWLAGVPALLNDEPAFRELWRSPLDYCSVDCADDVVAAIARLRAAPQLYAAMVRNGRERAREYDIDAVREHWMRLIVDVIAPDATRVLASRSTNSYVSIASQMKRMVAQKAQDKAFRRVYDSEIAQYRASTDEMGQHVAERDQREPRRLG